MGILCYLPYSLYVGDLFLDRNYETDADNIRKWLSKFKERGFKRIVIFPEGTRSRNKQKLHDSQEYHFFCCCTFVVQYAVTVVQCCIGLLLDSNRFAKKNNLPPLNNVLYPRTKGFSLIAKYCKDNPGVVDYVYDYTFGYGGGGVGVWTFLQGPVYTGILMPAQALVCVATYFKV